MALDKTNSSYFLSRWQNVETGAEKFDSKEDSSSMAKNDENADSGSPSLSEEENNVSEQTPSDRPKFVVDLNIPLQHDSSEPGEGVVNYGFEFGENRRNDGAENFDDSKSLAKEKYVNESTDHHYSAALLGKVLNTSCDTEITIPDDPNMNCNKSKTRSGNAKNKENHITEKIPLEEVNSTVVPIISDTCEKALEAQKEYSATQNGGKDISHDRAGVNADKLNQQNNGKRFEEYFMPANTHKKFLRGEKLYLTKEKEVACSGWKLALVCGSLLLVILGVLLGVLAGLGMLVKEPAAVMKGSSLPDSASMSAEAKHSNELPLSSLPITLGPNSPSLQTVPKVLIVELILVNESFSDELLNNNSKEYVSLASHVRKMLTNRFKNLELNSSTMEIHNSSITARFITSLQISEMSESNIKEVIENYFKQNNNTISSYHIKNISVWFAEKFNTCLTNNGNCSHECHWNWRNYSQTCFCPSNFILSDDSKTCLKKQLGDGKINGVSTGKTALVPKATEAPSTHYSVQLVTNVDTTMPNLGSSTWTSASELTTIYDTSIRSDSESLVKNHPNDVFSTEQSVTSYSGDDHKVDISETTPNENQILELTTEGRVGYTSDLSTLKYSTQQNDNNNVITTTDIHWPMTINLTDSVEVTGIYNSDNNTSDTSITVTDSQFSQPVTNYTTVTDFSNATGSEMLVTVGDSSVLGELSTVSESIENSITNRTGDVGLVSYESGTVTKATSTVMFSNTIDQNTTGGKEALDAVTVRAEETTPNEIVTETLSTNSSKTFINWNNASNITTVSTIVDSDFTANTDTYNQTTITPLLLNITNSANLSDNTSLLYVTSTESTASGQETLSVQNITKEQTFRDNFNVENSSEVILYMTGSSEESITSQMPSISKPSVSYDSNITGEPAITITVSSDFPSTNSEQISGENESMTEININFGTLDTTFTSEEAFTEGKTSFDTTTNHFYLTNSSANETIHHTDDEITNDHSTPNNFITDVQNITNLHSNNITEVLSTVLTSAATVVNNITEDSRSILSSAVTNLSNITELSTDVFSSNLSGTTDINENLGHVFPFSIIGISNTTVDPTNNFSITEISDTTEVPKSTLSLATTVSSNTGDPRDYLSSAITGVNNITEISRNDLTSAVTDINNITEDSSNSLQSTTIEIDNVTKDPGSIHSATTDSNFMEGSKNTSGITNIDNVTEDQRYISSVTDFGDITEDSRNDSSFAGTILSETLTTAHIQTNGILHEIEKPNVSTTEPPNNSTFEDPIQGIDEITSDVISAAEMTSVLSTDYTDANYIYDANSNFTVVDSDVSVGPNHSNSVQSMDFTTYSDYIDTNTSNMENNGNSTISSGFSFNSTEITTSIETGHVSNLDNISSDYYESTSEVGTSLNFSDLPVNQMNTTEIAIHEENRTEVADTDVYFRSDNRSLKDDNFTNDNFNQSDFEVTIFSSNTEYENQTDAENIIQPLTESGGFSANETEHSICLEGMFACSDGITCLDLIQQCDGIRDCPDGSDESQCEEDCMLNFFCVNTSMCISASAKCDNIWDCKDGSDEVGCEPTSCGVKEVMCSDGSACIKPADICNEQYNCHDKSDEVGCVERTTCDTTNRFFCPEGLCIPLAQVCDAVQDCRNGEDEANCSCTGSDVFQCSNSVCLTKDVFCDGKVDCQDGSDERGCVRIDVNGIVQIYDHNNQTWKVLCTGNWSIIEADYVCQDLGFGSASESGMLLVDTDIGWMKRNNYTANNSTLWTLGMEPVDFCINSTAATVKCKEYACGGNQTQFRRKRGTGGQESGHLPGLWTSLAILYSSESNRTCYGVVISPVWVLTSSQCLISHLLEFNDLSVQAGIIRSNERVVPKPGEMEPQERKAQEVVIHPHSSVHRSPALRDYDVALVRINEPFNLDSNDSIIYAICLGDEEIQEGITCFTGTFQSRTADEPYIISPRNHLAVSVIDRNSCNSTEHYSKSITNRMICGQTTGSTSLCNSDDGVPLMCFSTMRKYYVAGMLSYQHNCGIYYKQPAVFSNINDMKPFIDMVIGKYRYNVPYDGTLYFKVTNASATTESDSAEDFNVTTTTVQTTVLSTTNTASDTGSTDAITLTQISNFMHEANTTVLSGDNFAHMTTTVMAQVYLSNETEPDQNTTSDILEDSSNKTVLLKLVSNTDILQDYKATATDAIDEPENDNSTFVTTTTTTSNDFLLLKEILSTIPSIQEANNTEDSNDTKEKKALNYESSNVNTTVLMPVTSTEVSKLYHDTTLSLTKNQPDDNANTSNTFETLVIENTTWTDATHPTVETATEVLNSDAAETVINNPVTEIANNDSIEAQTNNPTTETSAIKQHLFSQSHKEHISQLNISNTSEHGLITPTVMENLIEMTILINTGVPEETTQSSKSSITDVTDALSNIYEDAVPINETGNSTKVVNSTPAVNNNNFDIAVPSLNNSTFVNTSLANSLLSFKTPDYPSTASDIVTTDNIQNVTIEKQSDFQSTGEMSINATESGLIKEEIFSSVPDEETSINTESFDKSSITLPSLQEHNNASNLNYTTTFEPPISEDNVTHLSSECGTQDLQEANTTWPYIGTLKGNMTCLANIISSKWVITSHHCLLSGAPSNGTTWTFLKGHFHSSVKNILVHPQSEMLGIDVALVELDDSLEKNSSICLPKYNITTQHHCEIVRSIENVEGESKIIYIPVSEEPVMNCDIFHNQSFVQSICINNIKQTCQDSGTPLMCINDADQWQLQGISGIKSNEDNSTCVYTDVTSLVPWIEESAVL